MANLLADHIHKRVTELRGLLNELPQSGAPEKHLAWQERIGRIEAQAEYADGIAVAFLGGTGSGKSSLINALLETDLLPTSSIQACTSAPIEITWGDLKSYQATLEFVPLESWQQECEQFLATFASPHHPGEAAHQAFLNKAWTLYGLQGPASLHGIAELIRQPLPAGKRAQVKERSRTLKAREPGELCEQLTSFFASPDSSWPLLKSIRIRGAFPLLKTGLRLIDLPGLNDPNQARENMTRDYFGQAEFLWVVCDATRGLTGEMAQLMHTSHFLRHMVMDNRVSALTFVLSKTDQINPALARRQLHLPPHATPPEILAAYRQQTAAHLKNQLHEFCLGLQDRYGNGNQDALRIVQETLVQSPVFALSAHEYMSLTGILATPPRYCDSPDQSGLPVLIEHLGHINEAYGAKARRKLIDAQYRQLKQEIAHLARQLKAPTEQPLPDKERLQQLRLKLEKYLAQILEAWHGNLADHQKTFIQKLRSALSPTSGHIEGICQKWQEIQWQGMQQAVRHGGVYQRGPVRVDLLEDVLDEVLKPLELDWNTYFSHQLEQQSQDLTHTLLQLLDKYAADLRQCGSPPDLLQTSRAVLEEQQTQHLYQSRLWASEQRRELLRQLEQGIRDGLQPAFAAAGQEKGTGMKNRILTVLEDALRELLPKALAKACHEQEQALQNLNRQLQRQGQQFAETLLRYSRV